MKSAVEEILSLKTLKIGYKTGNAENIILPELNATAYKGELIAVIGKNGAGKSTLLRTIAGLQQSLGGTVCHDGKDILKFSRIELARKVGYISTEIVRAANMNVYDLVALGRFPYTDWTGRIDNENQIKIAEAIRNTGMSALTSRYISEISDGERQRAMIARILAQDTHLMIMDEPTAFLDIGSKYEILYLLHNLAKNSGKTVIFSTHDLHIAISQADKIWLLTNKKLIEGAPEDLMLAGDFENLFESSSVRYDSDHGTFSFHVFEKGTIYVEGEGIIRHLTEKALSRIGFVVTGIKSKPCLIVPSGENKFWHLVTNNSTFRFSSIYELTSSLNNLDLKTI